MTTTPLVTVIVPAYNAQRYLGDALRSVFDQEFRDFEVIVVDDGSIDGTAEVAATFDAVTVLRQANGGVARARNAGIAAARGRLIAFLDADDRWRPNKLRVQVAVMQSEPAPDYVLGEMQCFADHGFVPADWMRKALFSPHLAHSTGTMLAHRSVFDRVGGFDPDAVPAETMDWFARATDAGLVGATIDELVLLRRFHESNHAAYGVTELNEKLVAVLRRSVERKRTRR